jgi:hypothetical protein
LLGEELIRFAAEGQHRYCLVKTTSALTTLHELEDYLTSQLQLALWTEGTKYFSQASTW